MLQNQGEEISLRLRTDDLKGFRKYQSIKKTLLHELVSIIQLDKTLYILCRVLCFLSRIFWQPTCDHFKVLIYYLFILFQAHMIYSEHDANFYALDKQVQELPLSLSFLFSLPLCLCVFVHAYLHMDFEQVHILPPLLN